MPMQCYALYIMQLNNKATTNVRNNNPLHVILNNSKLAYRIYVILIANKELIKNMSGNASTEESQCIYLGLTQFTSTLHPRRKISSHSPL
jgi:hypothetical protein